MLDDSKLLPAIAQEEAKTNTFTRNGFTVKDGAEWLKNIKPIQWLYKGFLVRGYCYTFTSPTNHGKTTVVCNMIAAALGNLRIGRYENTSGRPLNVILLCGENDVDTAHKVQSALNLANVRLGKDGVGNLMVVDRAFPIASYGADAVAYINSLGVDFDLAFVDTWQAYWSGGDFNNNDAQLAHAHAMQYLTRINGNPAVVVPAHPPKGASKDNLVPYGGGAAMNAIDGNFTGWKDGEVFTLELGKKRQPDIEPMSFELLGVTIPQLLDSDGHATPSVAARYIEGHVADNQAIDAKELRDQIIRAVDRLSRITGNRVTKATIAMELGISEGKLRSPLDILSGKGGSKVELITTRPIELTKEGKKYLKEIT